MQGYKHLTQTYIDGEWRATHGEMFFDVINPANEQVVASIAAANEHGIAMAFTGTRHFRH